MANIAAAQVQANYERALQYWLCAEFRRMLERGDYDVGQLSRVALSWTEYEPRRDAITLKISFSTDLRVVFDLPRDFHAGMAQRVLADAGFVQAALDEAQADYARQGRPARQLEQLRYEFIHAAHAAGSVAELRQAAQDLLRRTAAPGGTLATGMSGIQAAYNQYRADVAQAQQAAIQQQELYNHELRAGRPEWYYYGERPHSAEAIARGKALLRTALSPEQLIQFDRDGTFTCVGNVSGATYRVRDASFSFNVDKLDASGTAVERWCFVPEGHLVPGDIMLAQKIALECDENAAYCAANKRPAAVQVQMFWPDEPAPVRQSYFRELFGTLGLT